MASAPFSTAALAQSQSPAGARSSGVRNCAGLPAKRSRSAPDTGGPVARLVGWLVIIRKHSLLAQNRVALSPIGVGIGIVQVIMEPAAFGTRERALDDHLGHRRDVAQLQQITGDDKVPIIFLDFLPQIGDALLGAPQALGGPHDA